MTDTKELLTTPVTNGKIVRGRLSRRMENVGEAATLRIATRAQLLRSEGRSIISLSTGEPDFPTPENIKQAGIRAIEQNITRYTAVEGLLELREAIAEKLGRDNKIHVTADCVQVASGGKHALSNALAVLLERGDEVLIPSPFWVSYPAMAAISEATSVLLPTRPEEGWILDPEVLRRAITPHSRVLVLNTPVNPTSAMYTEENLRALVPVIKESGIVVVVDELYEKLTYDDRKHFSIGSIEEIRDQVITVNGMSKAYAMTGWRVGYAAGPRSIIEAMNRLQSQAVSHPSAISQKAAIEALRGPQVEVEKMRAKFQERRDLVVSLMGKIEGISFTRPLAAFYVFFNVSKFFGKKTKSGEVIHSAEEICTTLLEDFGIALVAGNAFGDPNSVRLSFAASEADIREGINRIKAGLSSLA